ncbi:MAG: hypothetical protein JWQ72_3983, partial [Polaromonas sp.]|nr:hypothetical protein [Polaromonas sp.]
IGAVAGGVIGAVAGGLGGKAAAEAVNPTAEEAYWRENYNREPYYQSGRSFDDYAPAYRMGVSGYNQYAGSSYDERENEFESQWEGSRGGSALSWPEASAASRAAWTRAGSQVSQGRAGDMSTTAAMSSGSDSGARNDDVIDVLNNLLETSHDGEYGFRECAEHVKSQDIKTLLARRADDCRNAIAELQALIRQAGGEPDTGGTTSGAMHRGWVSLRGNLAGFSDEAMLDECERGEDVALAQYRKALKQDLPAAVKAVVERQAQGVQRNHDQIKALRDTVRSSAA